MAYNRFPLFRIPFLALRIILDFYSPHEIIHLSLCSKRSLRVAKQCWKKKWAIRTCLSAKSAPNIDIFFDEDPTFYYRFVISEAQRFPGELMHNIRIGDAVVSCIHEETETVTFWKNKLIGIKGIVGYIKDLFDVPITKIELKSEGYENEFINIVDCIMKLQESVQDCTLNTVGPIDACLTHLLDNCKITGNLFIYGEPSREFRNDWNIQLDSIYLSEGLCLTFQNLTNIDCQSLELYSPSLTSEDLNQFLKHWQNGGNSRMRYAWIEINSLDQETVTSGIDAVLQSPQRFPRYYRGTNNMKRLMLDALDIRRNDGKTGSVSFYSDRFQFGVDPINGSGNLLSTDNF